MCRYYTGCCRNPFSLGLKRFSSGKKSAGLQAMSKLALRAQKADIAYLPLRLGFFGKKRFNDRSKGFVFGQLPAQIRLLARKHKYQKCLLTLRMVLGQYT